VSDFIAVGLLHVLGAYSLLIIMFRKKYRERYSLHKSIYGLIPIADPLPEKETYLLFGTRILIVKNNSIEGGYLIMRLDKEVGLNYLIENYPEEKIQPFLFNLNLFR